MPWKRNDIRAPPLVVVFDFMNISRVYVLIYNSVMKANHCHPGKLHNMATSLGEVIIFQMKKGQ